MTLTLPTFALTLMLAGPGPKGCCGMCAGENAAPATQPAAAGVVIPDSIRTPMDVFHRLLTDHTKIRRNVTDIPGGVESVTTSDDPLVAALIRLHVNQMKARLESGQPIRRWDPLFAEIFRRADAIEMQVESIPGGVRVRETSTDEQVTLLIRQHAHRGVSEFVARGFDRAHEASPLPDGYRPR